MTIKILALTTAAVLSAASAQAQTADMFSADVTAMAGRIVLNDEYDTDYSFNDGTSQALSFRLMANFGGNMFGQLDYGVENNVDGGSVAYSGESGSNSYSAQGVALHFGMVNGDTTYGAMYSRGYNGYEDINYNTLAVEAVTKMGAGALSGQLGLTRSEDGEENATFGRVAYAMDVNDKTTVTASLGLGKWTYDDSGDLNLTTLGLEAAYKISDNASILIAYQGNNAAEASEDEYWNSSTLYVGVRLSLGGASKPVFADYNPIYGIQHAKFSNWE